MATKLITVKGTGDDHRVILWDKDPLHPKGEAFVSNDGKEHKVAETAAVKQAIGDGRLVKVETMTFAAKKDDSKGKEGGEGGKP